MYQNKRALSPSEYASAREQRARSDALPSDRESNKLEYRGHQEKVPLIELQVREYISTFIWLGLLAWLTAGLKVPLDISPRAEAVSQSKAPWVFGSIQWLLQRWPAWLSGWVLPLVSMAVLFTLPWWGQIVGKMWTALIFVFLSSVWVALTLLYLVSG